MKTRMIDSIFKAANEVLAAQPEPHPALSLVSLFEQDEKPDPEAGPAISDTANKARELLQRLRDSMDAMRKGPLNLSDLRTFQSVEAFLGELCGEMSPATEARLFRKFVLGRDAR